MAGSARSNTFHTVGDELNEVMEDVLTMVGVIGSIAAFIGFAGLIIAIPIMAGSAISGYTDWSATAGIAAGMSAAMAGTGLATAVVCRWLSRRLRPREGETHG